jgi:hypothetical protein
VKVCVVALVCAACGTSGNSGGGGTGSDGGNGSGSGSGNGGGEWTTMPLVDDTANNVVRKQDRVSGIYFESLNKGWIVSQGADQSFGHGGAVFTASQHAVTSIALSGAKGGPSVSGTTDFIGIEKTPTGYIAMSSPAALVQSTNGGATFKISALDTGTEFALEPILDWRVTSTGTTLVRENGYVTTAASAPGSDTVYTDVWAPEATPAIPVDPVPDDECQGGPHGTGLPVMRSSVYISPDRMLVAYTSNLDHNSQLCISRDGGNSFRPIDLTPPEADDDVPATGVLFLNATTGILWLGNGDIIGTPFLKRTTDGGASWHDIALPASVASARVDLPGAFFAPDGMHGWIVGYNRDAETPLLLATSDAGATWTTFDNGLTKAVAEALGDKLFCGFALDATHFWVGGARGVLLAHN